MSRTPDSHDERGFTLVEVLVAIFVLLVGVLGVVAMVDGANVITGKTKAREGANNVSRSVVEVARAVPYKNLSNVSLLSALAGRPGLGDVSAGSAYTVSARNVDYDVTLEVCSMDDPKDNLGPHDGLIEFCADSDVGNSSGTFDRNPDDYKRIAITVTWQSRNKTETMKQTSLVSNPVGGLGPTVTRLDAPAVGGIPKTVTAPGAIRFEADTSTAAAELDWTVDGAAQGKADPIGSSDRKFEFFWDIEGSAGGRYWDDCTYVVQAEAFDDKGRAGSPKAMTIVLNRRVPFAPKQLEGGRNGNGDMVDLQWKGNTECDVLGYHVYRSTAGSAGPWTPVTCLGQTGSYLEATSCIDDQAPAGGTLSYYVAAVDTDSAGSVRNGDASDVLDIQTGNSVPSQPTNLTACLGGTPGCVEPDGTPASDGSTAITWDASTDTDGILFYRIYRDGFTYADRVGVFFPQGSGALTWTDPDTPSGPHTYAVSAVDPFFGESQLSAPVVNFP
jgi:prepilin-type N-terminal cleavage/methylation domain-containing protein